MLFTTLRKREGKKKMLRLAVPLTNDFSQISLAIWEKNAGLLSDVATRCNDSALVVQQWTVCTEKNSF